jgi:hypothetical protein
MIVRAAVAWLLATMFIAACGPRGGGEPPRPDRSLVPDIVGLAEHWEFGPCGTYRFTMRSGQAVEVAGAASPAEGCPSRPALIRGFDHGTSGSEAGASWARVNAPLIFVGRAADQPWWGAVSSEGDGTCWRLSFADDQGAYFEGVAMHLSNGVVLSVAKDFRLPIDEPAPFPLRIGDALCLNEQGQVVSVSILHDM